MQFQVAVHMDSEKEKAFQDHIYNTSKVFADRNGPTCGLNATFLYFWPKMVISTIFRERIFNLNL